jgi:hypothetical protein
LTEEQITEIFSGAGRVLNFRLVYDRETGRPKGFGFAEFPDYGMLHLLYRLEIQRIYSLCSSPQTLPLQQSGI